MQLRDKLKVKRRDKVVLNMVYVASTQTQHLFSKPESIVEVEEKAVIWNEGVGAVEFIPIKKKHNFIQVDENTWELDIELIDKDDL